MTARQLEYQFIGAFKEANKPEKQHQRNVDKLSLFSWWSRSIAISGPRRLRRFAFLHEEDITLTESKGENILISIPIFTKNHQLNSIP